MTLTINNKDLIESIFFRDVKSYKKTVPIKAVQVYEFFVVRTLEGSMCGVAGDYLCEGISGEKWPVKKEIFEKTYEEVK